MARAPSRACSFFLASASDRFRTLLPRATLASTRNGCLNSRNGTCLFNEAPLRFVPIWIPHAFVADKPRAPPRLSIETRGQNQVLKPPAHARLLFQSRYWLFCCA